MQRSMGCSAHCRCRCRCRRCCGCRRHGHGHALAVYMFHDVVCPAGAAGCMWSNVRCPTPAIAMVAFFVFLSSGSSGADAAGGRFRSTGVVCVCICVCVCVARVGMCGCMGGCSSRAPRHSARTRRSLCLSRKAEHSRLSCLTQHPHVHCRAVARQAPRLT